MKNYCILLGIKNFNFNNFYPNLNFDSNSNYNKKIHVTHNWYSQDG